jgi:hypothetical protein
VHVMYGDDSHGFRMEHGGMPILPGYVMHSTILHHAIHFINCSIRFEIQLSGAVHLDIPQSLRLD